MRKELTIYSVEFYSFEFPRDKTTVAYFQDKEEAFKVMKKLVEEKAVGEYDSVEEMDADHPTNIRLPHCMEGKPAMYFNNCFKYPLAYYINEVEVN